jgi:aquaporin Z
MREALREHWPEYLMEATELGLFMLSASLFTAILYYPASPVAVVLGDTLLTRFLTGLAMGLTAIAIIYSPMGQRSGAHFNPAVTLTFLRLGKVRPWDALFYALAQFAGGAAAMLLITFAARDVVSHPSVNYVATLPGKQGPWAAFAAEVAISFVLMSVILRVSNDKRMARYTAIFAGTLVATYITLESPISGMSMNPARTFSSALPGQLWNFLWIYFTAPPIGMLLAAELYVRTGGIHSVLCAKLHHDNPARCIFKCNYGKAR